MTEGVQSLVDLHAQCYFYHMRFLKLVLDSFMRFNETWNTVKGNYLNNVEFRVTDCTVKERQTPANTFTIFDYTNEEQCYNQERFHSNAYDS